MIRTGDIILSRLARFSICPLFGHAWGRKMSGRVCRRCCAFEKG